MKVRRAEMFVELTDRNIDALRSKLDYNAEGEGIPSACSIVKDGFTVTACEVMTKEMGDLTLTREDLSELTSGRLLHRMGWVVRRVPDAAHYSDREPGPMLDNRLGSLY